MPNAVDQAAKAYIQMIRSAAAVWVTELRQSVKSKQDYKTPWVATPRVPSVVMPTGLISQRVLKLKAACT